MFLQCGAILAPPARTGQVRDVRIPVAVSDDSAGFDGVFYELEIENVWTSCRIRWWCDLPSAWQGLKAPVAKMFEVLEAG
jgi:hypothetical protein